LAKRSKEREKGNNMSIVVENGRVVSDLGELKWVEQKWVGSRTAHISCESKMGWVSNGRVEYGLTHII